MLLIYRSDDGRETGVEKEQVMMEEITIALNEGFEQRVIYQTNNDKKFCYSKIQKQELNHPW